MCFDPIWVWKPAGHRFLGCAMPQNLFWAWALTSPRLRPSRWSCKNLKGPHMFLCSLYIYSMCTTKGLLYSDPGQAAMFGVSGYPTDCKNLQGCPTNPCLWCTSDCIWQLAKPQLSVLTSMQYCACETYLMRVQYVNKPKTINPKPYYVFYPSEALFMAACSKLIWQRFLTWQQTKLVHQWPMAGKRLGNQKKCKSGPWQMNNWTAQHS